MKNMTLTATIFVLAAVLGHASGATMTFYESVDGGACGFGRVSDAPESGMVTAVSRALWRDGAACGECYRLTCTGANCMGSGSVIVKVTDLCPEAGNAPWCTDGNSHFDVNLKAFRQLADPRVGHVRVVASKTCCAFDGVIRVRVDAYSEYFAALSVLGLPGKGSQAYSLVLVGKGGKEFRTSRTWGGVRAVSGQRLEGPFGLYVDFGNGRRCASRECLGIVPASGKTYDCAIECV